ncbi:PREDICTED: uncharacterized protein LOC104711148 isoform X1 [Camelina sativa]|uniref:Uncharacterized protein LOC104711148 isoform X1 n=1 Tax=Camelina sativa TaxID=90675 RepID=A0ABM0TGL1_CAMSA|nr:PREDICTED: uncharacterized protein LOC104711148 isoform X1 [Camelina sativa]
MMSGKMVHCFLSRSLKVSKKNEIWMHFGGQPMRFSIREFHMVTGLKCTEWGGDEDQRQNRYNWANTEDAHTYKDLLDILQETDPEEADERFSLAMLILIECIFLQRYKGNRLPAKNLKRAQHLDVLANYPWGKDAYNLLIKSVKKNVELNLRKNKYYIHGYPLALHLWILESVPMLKSAFSTLSVIERPTTYLCEKDTHIQLIHRLLKWRTLNHQTISRLFTSYHRYLMMQKIQSSWKTLLIKI